MTIDLSEDFKNYQFIEYSGEIVSSNSSYGANNWSVRHSKKKMFQKVFPFLFLEQKLRPMKEFGLFVEYDSRHDVDNVSGTVKYFVDNLKGKYIKNDGQTIFKWLFIKPKRTLGKNTIRFNLYYND